MSLFMIQNSYEYFIKVHYLIGTSLVFKSHYVAKLIYPALLDFTGVVIKILD